MDPRLHQAAESGSIDELYALIDENPYILENIDVVPFVNTPLHVAAASGNTQFSMEMLNLKPSFAKKKKPSFVRKLNTRGDSPLHLAVDKDQIDFVSKILWLDHSLARVKGRNGITPFLFLVLRGNADLVAECLLTCPECIQDVSMDGQNALHLAVMNDRYEVLQVLTEWTQRMSQSLTVPVEIKVLNKKNFSYNTALHLAAYKNDHLAVRLLLDCLFLERNEVNGDGLIFLDILRNQGQNEGGWNLDLEQVVLKTGCNEAMSDFSISPISFWRYCSDIMRHLRSNISDEARGVFLIVCTLIITATYQTALQPPGGVHQSDANVGSVVMKQTFFIFLWVSNTVGFCCTVFYTFCLIPLGNMFATWFFWIGTCLCISYALAMAVISPHPLVFLSATFTFFMLFALNLLLDVFLNHWRKHRT